MYKSYLEAISLTERVHRHFLEIVQLELDGLGIRDISNVQALMLFNVGDAEMTVGELMWRGVLPRFERVAQPQENGRKRLSLAGTLGA